MRPFWLRFKDAGLAVLLLFAALNAVSYFFRSTHPSLVGRQDGQDAIGFPWLAWAEERRFSMITVSGVTRPNSSPFFLYGTVHLGADGVVSYAAMLADLVCALTCAGIVGLLAGAYGKWQPTTHRRPAAQQQTFERARLPQFSLRGLFVAVTMVALVMGLDRIAADRLRVAGLGAIYAFGPAILALTAAVCRRSGRIQVAALWLTLTVLLSGALVLGVHSTLGDFTRVLLGLFVFWTPQCVLALAVLAAWRACRSFG